MGHSCFRRPCEYTLATAAAHDFSPLWPAVSSPVEDVYPLKSSRGAMNENGPLGASALSSRFPKGLAAVRPGSQRYRTAQPDSLPSTAAARFLGPARQLLSFTCSGSGGSILFRANRDSFFFASPSHSNVARGCQRPDDVHGEDDQPHLGMTGREIHISCFFPICTLSISSRVNWSPDRS